MKQTYTIEIETDYGLIDISPQIAEWVEEKLIPQVKSEDENATLNVNCDFQGDDID